MRGGGDNKAGCVQFLVCSSLILKEKDEGEERGYKAIDRWYSHQRNEKRHGQTTTTITEQEVVRVLM
jgi:hypothetical protein